MSQGGNRVGGNQGADREKRRPLPPDIACMDDFLDEDWGEVKLVEEGLELLELEEGKRREVTLEDIGTGLLLMYR